MPPDAWSNRFKLEFVYCLHLADLLTLKLYYGDYFI